jgi:hypothetical protein
MAEADVAVQTLGVRGDAGRLGAVSLLRRGLLGGSGGSDGGEGEDRPQDDRGGVLPDLVSGFHGEARAGAQEQEPHADAFRVARRSSSALEVGVIDSPPSAVQRSSRGI